MLSDERIATFVTMLCDAESYFDYALVDGGPQFCDRVTDIIREALAEQSATHAIELRAYEATVQNLEQRIRELEALMVPGGFPSDVMTAAGLVYHGKRDKVLAERLRIGAQSMLAAAPKGGEVMSERIDTGYSASGDDQFTDDLYAVFEDLRDNDALHVGATYYEQDFRPIRGRDVLNARAVIDAGDEALSEIAGERYACDLDVSDEAVKELQELLDGWLKKHTNVMRCYSVGVGSVRECKVTAEQIEDFGGDE